jgi:hypothetical protein
VYILLKELATEGTTDMTEMSAPGRRKESGDAEQRW